MTIPTISTLPVAPARTDAPATFVTRADSFLAALVVMQGQLNTTIGAMNTDIAGVNSNASAAAASASAAAASATTAASAAGASLWVSGQAYAEGDAAISIVNYQTYRAETATSGTTDPSSDSNWTAISGTFPVQAGNDGRFLQTNGTNVSWAAAAAAAGEIQVVASENITAGQSLILKANGQAAPVSGTQLAGYATSYVNAAGPSAVIRTAFDEANKKIIIAQSSNIAPVGLNVRVGVVTSGGIVFGTAAVTYAAHSWAFDVGYDESAERVIVAYKGASNYGYVVIGQIIGSNISFGTPVQFTTTQPYTISLSKDTANNKWTMAWANNGSALYGSIITISNITPSITTPANLSVGATHVSSMYDAVNARTVMACAYGTGGVRAVAFTSNGSVLTKVGTHITVSIFGADQKNQSIVYNSQEDVYVVSCEDSARKAYAFAWKINAISTTTLAVTVADAGSGNKYYIDGVLQASLQLTEGNTYIFDQSASTNTGHPLVLSTTSDGTHGGGTAYTTGVTTVGTAGSAGAYTQIVVATSAPTLYYYCSAHSGMGGTASTPVFATYSAGTPIKLNNNAINDSNDYSTQTAVYMTAINTTYIRTNTVGSGQQKYNEITVSGTTISENGKSRTIDPRYFGNSVQDTAVSSAIYASSINAICVVSANVTGDPDGTFAKVISVGYETTNAADYIGLAAEDIASGATGRINIISATNNSVSGLSTNTEYWLAYDGSFSSTETTFSKIGLARSATSILLTANSLNATFPAYTSRRAYEVNGGVSSGDLLFVDSSGLPAPIEKRFTVATEKANPMNNYSGASPSVLATFTQGYFANLPTPDGGGLMVMLGTSNYPYVIPYVNNGGTITFGYAYNINNGYGVSNTPAMYFDAVWDDAVGQWVFIIQHSTSYYVYMFYARKKNNDVVMESSHDGGNSIQKDYLGAHGGNNWGVQLGLFPQTGDYVAMMQNASGGSYANIQFRRHAPTTGKSTLVGAAFSGGLPVTLAWGWGWNSRDNIYYMNKKYSAQYYFDGYIYNAASDVYQTSGTGAFANFYIAGTSFPSHSNSTYAVGIPSVYDPASQKMLFMHCGASGYYMNITALTISATTPYLAVVAGSTWTDSYNTYNTYSKPRWQIAGESGICIIGTGGRVRSYMFDGTVIYRVGTENASTYNSNGVYYQPQTDTIYQSWRTATTTGYYSYAFSSFSSNSTSFFGIANSNTALGLNAEVDLIGGINTSQSGLVGGSTYYAGADGVLTTSSNTSRVGLAINATNMYIKG